MNRAALLQAFDRAIATVAEHGHSGVMDYPYAVFVQAMRLHDGKGGQ